MTDLFSKKKRSEIMSSIRSKNTRAEVLVFRHLRRQKIYFQKHYSRVIGKPDIALPRKKKAVFIDGDFWHGRNIDKLLLKHPAGSFWAVKISTNMQRDLKQRTALREMGWLLLEVWESDLMRKRTRDSALSEIEKFLLR